MYARIYACHLTKLAAPGSRVFFFSSSTTKFSGVPPNYVVYTATKGAVEQMTRVLAKDLGAKGINVNCIAPGPVDTELFRRGKPEQLINFFANLHPQKRVPVPDEIAPIVAFLSRDEAGWINGQTIFVNGVSTHQCVCKTSAYISVLQGFAV